MKKLFHELMKTLGFLAQILFAGILIGLAFYIGYEVADIRKVCLIVVKSPGLMAGCLP